MYTLDRNSKFFVKSILLNLDPQKWPFWTLSKSDFPIPNPKSQKPLKRLRKNGKFLITYYHKHHVKTL